MLHKLERAVLIGILPARNNGMGNSRKTSISLFHAKVYLQIVYVCIYEQDSELRVNGALFLDQ